VSDPRVDFDTWLGVALRRPVRTEPSARARIMERVRDEVRSGRPALAPGHRPRALERRRRGWVAGHAGALLAAGVAGLVVLGALDGVTGLDGLRGDRGGARPVAEAAIRDTLRLVRFVLAAPAASSVALVGDFNGWSASATPLAADRAGAWAVAVALSPGRHRYAYVVDDTQWMTDPLAPAVADSGRPASMLFVGETR
jgi:hypothetical protein